MVTTILATDAWYTKGKDVALFHMTMKAFGWDVSLGMVNTTYIHLRCTLIVFYIMYRDFLNYSYWNHDDAYVTDENRTR